MHFRAFVISAGLIATSPAWAADKSLYGDYVYAPLITNPADCAQLLASYDPETTQTITISATEIQSNFEGFGPVQFGKASKGGTPFVMQADGPDEITTRRGKVLDLGELIVFDYGPDRPNDPFCRLQR